MVVGGRLAKVVEGEDESQKEKDDSQHGASYGAQQVGYAKLLPGTLGNRGPRNSKNLRNIESSKRQNALDRQWFSCQFSGLTMRLTDPGCNNEGRPLVLGDCLAEGPGRP